jgi:metal-dependent hydrolase (beta-lactamase superfamily II)
VCFCFFLRRYLTKKCEKRADSVLKTGGGTAIMIDAGYNYERLAEKMAWPGIAPQSIRHILITHQAVFAVAGNAAKAYAAQP